MANMAIKLYVGNLSYETTEDQLIETFSAYGSVTNANIVRDRDTNQPKGFGFVEMEDNSAGNTAIMSLNGTEINGRELRVSEARPKQNRDQRKF